MWTTGSIVCLTKASSYVLVAEQWLTQSASYDKTKMAAPQEVFIYEQASEQEMLFLTDTFLS